MLEVGLILLAVGWYLAMGAMFAGDFNNAFDGGLHKLYLIVIAVGWPIVLVACLAMIYFCNDEQD